MRIDTVILDWAGTTVDFGCFAPVAAFKVAFNNYGLYPTLEQIRRPMGMPKRAHIETMLRQEEFAGQLGGRDLENLRDAVYNDFEALLMGVLENHADPLPHVVETVEVLRDMGMRIGSTTGYTTEMMEVVVPIARAQGYSPDYLVCPDEVAGIGRPYPYMLFKNLQAFKAISVHQAIKVGDTAADIEEGKNAGVISVGGD